MKSTPETELFELDSDDYKSSLTSLLSAMRPIPPDYSQLICSSSLMTLRSSGFGELHLSICVSPSMGEGSKSYISSLISYSSDDMSL